MSNLYPSLDDNDQPWTISSPDESAFYTLDDDDQTWRFQSSDDDDETWVKPNRKPGDKVNAFRPKADTRGSRSHLTLSNERSYRDDIEAAKIIRSPARTGRNRSRSRPRRSRSRSESRSSLRTLGALGLGAAAVAAVATYASKRATKENEESRKERRRSRSRRRNGSVASLFGYVGKEPAAVPLPEPNPGNQRLAAAGALRMAGVESKTRIACIPCHTRKIKCGGDARNPCTPCLKGDRECTYRNPNPRLLSVTSEIKKRYQDQQSITSRPQTKEQPIQQDQGVPKEVIGKVYKGVAEDSNGLSKDVCAACDRSGLWQDSCGFPWQSVDDLQYQAESASIVSDYEDAVRLYRMASRSLLEAIFHVTRETPSTNDIWTVFEHVLRKIENLRKLTPQSAAKTAVNQDLGTENEMDMWTTYWLQLQRHHNQLVVPPPWSSLSDVSYSGLAEKVDEEQQQQQRPVSVKDLVGDLGHPVHSGHHGTSESKSARRDASVTEHDSPNATPVEQHELSKQAQKNLLRYPGIYAEDNWFKDHVSGETPHDDESGPANSKSSMTPRKRYRSRSDPIAPDTSSGRYPRHHSTFDNNLNTSELQHQDAKNAAIEKLLSQLSLDGPRQADDLNYLRMQSYRPLIGQGMSDTGSMSPESSSIGHFKADVTLPYKLPPTNRPTSQISRTSNEPLSIRFPVLGTAKCREHDSDIGKVADDDSRASATRGSSQGSWTDDEGFDPNTAGFSTMYSSVLFASSTSVILLFKAALRRHANESSRSTGYGTLQANPTGIAVNLGGSRKRLASQRNSDDDNGDGEDGRDKRQRKKCLNDPGRDQRLLACPFHKFDGFLFGPDSPEPSYHVCGTAKFVHAAHLKQHLQRNHTVPKIYCYRCCRNDFNTNASLKAHQRAQPVCDPCDPPLYVERIDQDLGETLKLGRKNDSGINRVDYWYEVFDTLFPEERQNRSISPYFEGPGREFLNAFLSFSRRVVGSVVAHTIDEHSTQGHFSHTAQDMTSCENDVLEEAVRLFDVHLEARRWPRLTQAQSRADLEHSRTNSQQPATDGPAKEPELMDTVENYPLDTSLFAAPSVESMDSNVRSIPGSDVAFSHNSDSPLLSSDQELFTSANSGPSDPLWSNDEDFDKLLGDFTGEHDDAFLLSQPTEAEIKAKVQCVHITNAMSSDHQSFSSE